MAFDQIDTLFQEKKNISNIYKVNCNFYRQSGALHDIYLTGKFSRNFLARPIVIDNLLTQFNLSGKQSYFIGSEYPMLNLGDGNNPINSKYQKQLKVQNDNFPFSQICQESTNIFYNVESIDYNLLDDIGYNPEKLKDLINREYQYLDFESDELNRRVYNCLEESDIINDKNKSDVYNPVYYSTLIDHLNHALSKKHPRTYLNTYAIEKSIMK